MLAQLRVTVAADLCRVAEFLIRILRISAVVVERRIPLATSSYAYDDDAYRRNNEYKPPNRDVESARHPNSSE
jgi:hypothetical protein